MAFFRSTLALATITLLSCCWLGCSSARRFDDPNRAVTILVESMRANDQDQLTEILGASGKELLYSGDPVNDKTEVQRFLAAYDESHRLVLKDDRTISLVVGSDEWPMPIPIVQENLWDKWYFDTEAGKQEILNRRIGRNELDTIQTCLAIVDAQREYAADDPEQLGAPVYAEKVFSDPGRKNGLYWETPEGALLSPLGPLAAAAESQGYTMATAAERAANGPRPYHGYHFRLLKLQGPSASGGERNYMVGGRLLGGFGVIAYPATYGTSGIMTFIVNHDAKIYQRDLGPNTAKVAADIESFDPDGHWNVVPQANTSPVTAAENK